MNIVVIPARAGSKGIPNKNLQKIAGISLVRRAALNASKSTADVIFVSTDSDAIAREVLDVPKIEVHMRSPQNSSDEATTESVIQEVRSFFSDKINLADKIAILQATSPFTRVETINRAFEIAKHGVSTVSVIESVQFRWKLGANKYCDPTNHSKKYRPRRQDVNPELVETGACYAFTVGDFDKHKSRFSRKVTPILQSESESLDIDTRHDLELARSIVSKDPQLYGKYKKFLKRPKLIFTDFDGCLTDDLAHLNEFGHESVTINRKDGAAISRLSQDGVRVVVISSETNPVVRFRAQKLKIDCLQDVKNKISTANKFLSENGIMEDEVWFIGNDLNDMEPAIQFFSLCPSDAVEEIKRCSDIVLETRGGKGIFAEVAQLLYEPEQ